MSPRTTRTPKFLLQVAGRPFGAWLLDRLVEAGFGEVMLCISHLGDEIREVIGERWGPLDVRYSDEGPVRLGTAGALRAALPSLAPTFLVTYGDSYLPFDYHAPLRDLEEHPAALGTLAVYRNQDRFDASNTAIREDQVVRYHKRAMTDPPDPELDHIDYGAMALRREVIAALPEGKVMGLDAVQQELAARGRLRAFPVATRFHEIGSESGLQALEAFLGGAAPVRPAEREQRS
ncbi:nucleotidyl transferase [Chondromyces crocatus]|uniref:Nucleotidyl transferase n=2 Tax=Chondromyces crocatus TaxID=52 RepID=A0A0K1EIY6_CHOCO|nr:nucleotidyl transferase [Chondromyces crocatus]